MSSHPTLIILAKAPRPGRVKTRLARDIGSIQAVWWYRHALASLLRRVAHDPRWRTRLAVTPDGSVADPVWPPGPPRVPQGRGDLGARMTRALAAAPPGPALLIGSDIPGIDAAHVARAFARLRAADAVLGPAEDGGYWAIGLRRGDLAARSGGLRGVRWSGPHTLEDTLASLAPLRVVLTDRLADIDSGADLVRFNRRSRRSGA